MSSPVCQRFEDSLAGRPVEQPAYAVYDWFVQNRPQVDWARLFRLGLGQIHHTILTRHVCPHVQIVETISGDRRDVRWITDRGELHEWYRGEWRQEHLIKTPADYRIMARAFADVEVLPVPEAYTPANDGLVLGSPTLPRTAFQAIQIDYVGLEQFSLDIASELPELLELIDLLNDLTYREFAAMTQTPARHLKLWENMSIETIGPTLYRQHLVPVYQRILSILETSGQQLHVHYDGKLQCIAGDVADLRFGGIDSFTEPPEGDMTVAEARAAWPEKYLWLHPNLGWYSQPGLMENVRRICRAAGPTRFCLMISEDIPPAWERTVPAVLEAIQ
ncbi:MAG: hypothetical protein PCFJNLEI_00175 [Verrucomicrobiae bacterium]|nr:hypothetical protein [Verrucomicrobiae bacterium]